MRITAGWVFILDGAVTAYDSSTIRRVVTSSTEAECSAMTIIGKENSWQRRMYQDIHGRATLPPTLIHGDNTASLALLGSGVTKRSRHFDIEWFKVKQLVEDGEFTVSWVKTDENVADFFTKKLPKEKFVYFRDRLMGAPGVQAHFDTAPSLSPQVTSRMVCVGEDEGLYLEDGDSCLGDEDSWLEDACFWETDTIALFRDDSWEGSSHVVVEFIKQSGIDALHDIMGDQAPISTSMLQVEEKDSVPIPSRECVLRGGG